jgi:YHS domain-containing protein
MRAAWLLFWALAVAVLLLPMLRRVGAPRRPAPGTADELVKDPVCQTYVARSRAVRGEAGGRPVYFCSDDCARRFDLQR